VNGKHLAAKREGDVDFRVAREGCRAVAILNCTLNISVDSVEDIPDMRCQYPFTPRISEYILRNGRMAVACVEDHYELAGVLWVDGGRREGDVLAVDGHTVHGYTPKGELAGVGSSDNHRELRLRRDVAELGDDFGERDRARGRVGKLGQSVELVGEEGLGRSVLGEEVGEGAVRTRISFSSLAEDD
jgi:hypothetical protein